MSGIRILERLHSVSLASQLAPEIPFLSSPSQCGIPGGLPGPSIGFLESQSQCSGLWSIALPTELSVQPPEYPLLRNKPEHS